MGRISICMRSGKGERKNPGGVREGNGDVNLGGAWQRWHRDVMDI